MPRARVFRPGGLRWIASGLAVLALAAWLGFAFFWEASSARPQWWIRLEHGCVTIEHGLSAPLPSQFRVGTILPYPPAGLEGFWWRGASERRLEWALDFRYALQSKGPVTSSGGPNPVLSVASAAVWRIVVIPLWPVVVLFGAVAFVSWRRYGRRRAPGDCPSCGYDRRGLAAEAKCPECGSQESSRARGRRAGGTGSQRGLASGALDQGD